MHSVPYRLHHPLQRIELGLFYTYAHGDSQYYPDWHSNVGQCAAVVLGVDHAFTNTGGTFVSSDDGRVGIPCASKCSAGDFLCRDGGEP